MKATSTYTTGLSVKSWTSVSANSIYDLSWGTTETCDLAKWADANACNGVGKPWGFTAIKAYVSSTDKGAVRAWHFFAERGQDRTKQWALEKTGVLNMLFYEFNDKEKGANAAGAAWSTTKSRYAWAVGTATYNAATTTIFGGAALATALLATIF